MDLPKSQNNENKQFPMYKKSNQCSIALITKWVCMDEDSKTKVVYWHLKFLMCGKIMAKAVEMSLAIPTTTFRAESWNF